MLTPSYFIIISTHQTCFNNGTWLRGIVWLKQTIQSSLLINSLVISQSPTAVLPSVTVASGTAVSNNIIDRFRQVKEIRLNSLSLWQLPPTETQAPTHPGGCSVTCIWKIYDVQTLQMSHDSKTLCDAPRGACLDQFVSAVFTSSALSGFMWWFNCTHKCFPLNITKCFPCFMSEVRNAVKHNATSLLVFGLMSECQSQLAVQLIVVEFMWSGPKWADWLTISHTDSTAKELRYWFNSVAKLSILPCESLGRNALLERRLVAKVHWLHFSAQMHQTVFTFVYMSSYLHLYKEKTNNSE